MDEEKEEEQPAPVPLVTHVNSFLHSTFSNVAVFINNHQIYMPSGLYARAKVLHFQQLQWAICEYEGFLHCKGYDYQEFLNDIKAPPLSEPFFTRRMKVLRRPDDFMLYGELGVDIFSTSELLYPFMKVSVRLISATPNFYMTSDNLNVSLGIVDCSTHTRRIALKDDHQKKRTDMLVYTPVEFNCLESLAKNFINPARQNQFIQENIFKNAPVCRIAIAMHTNSAFTRTYTENPFYYQQFDIGQIRIFRGGQPIGDFDAADNCRLYVTTMRAMNFQDDIPSIPIDNFKEHYVLVFDLTSMQAATENCPYPDLVGEPLRLELKTLGSQSEFSKKNA